MFIQTYTSFDARREEILREFMRKLVLPQIQNISDNWDKNIETTKIRRLYPYPAVSYRVILIVDVFIYTTVIMLTACIVTYQQVQFDIFLTNISTFIFNI